MSSTIFPLVFKAGIKRDITRFQGEYVEEGDWIRWYHTYLRKMEGIQSYQISNIPIFKWNEDTNYLPYFYVTTINNNLFTFVMEEDQVDVSQITLNKYISSDHYILGDDIISTNSNTTLPQIISANNTNSPNTLILYQGNNLQNINDITGLNLADAPDLVEPIENKTIPQTYISGISFLNYENTSSKFVIEKKSFAISKEVKAFKITPSMLSGGVAYNDPYLFIYGSNGSLLITGVNYGLTNLDVQGQTAGSKNTDGYYMSIGTDKVIYGTSTRGTANNFTMLFWTLSTLVLLTSQEPNPLPDLPYTTAQPTKLIWNKNVISKEVSILSSRSVVECEGLFYWVGTDKFYIYNGMVQELPNHLNQDFFFNSLDMTKRQLVYGVLYPRYKEIWWFYPEKVDGSNNYNIGDTMLCTRAVIYNIVEQTWYDTAITGIHAQYVSSLGTVFNMGIPKNYPPIANYLYQFDSTQAYTILNVPANTAVSRIVEKGVASSNTSNSSDGKGGGDAGLAFDNNYLTKFVQTELNGNVQYDYGEDNKQIVTYLGLLANNDQEYKLMLYGKIDPDGEESELFESQNVNLKAEIIHWIKLNEKLVKPYRIYGLRVEESKVPLQLTEIYFYSKSTEAIITVPIPSYFVTPIMSFASFSPLKNNDGIDNFMQISRIEPDVRTVPNKTANMSIVINSRTYAQDTIAQSAIYSFTDTTPRITMLYQGRQINFGIASTDYFQMGTWFFKAEKGAGQ